MITDAALQPVTFQALNAQHLALLEAQADERLDPTAAAAFVADAAAAGVQIESIVDRDSVRAMIGYWTATIARLPDPLVEWDPFATETAPAAGSSPMEQGETFGAAQSATVAATPPMPSLPSAPAPAPTLAGFDASQSPTLDDASNPFVGLASFDSEQANRFFGREQAAHDLLQHVLAAPLVVVSGGSGTGKSSLVRAGLIKALAANPLTANWQVAVCSPGRDPLGSILAALSSSDNGRTAVFAARYKVAAARVDVAGDPAMAAALAAARAGESGLLLVIDQMEELFSLAPERERDAAAEAIAAIAGTPKVHVVVTLRDEYLESERVRRVLPGLDLATAAEFRVPPLDPAGIRAAIAKPAEQAGLVFQDGLIDRLVADVGSDPAALPLLQYALLRLWRRRQGNRITAQVYDEVGGPATALGNAAQQVYDGLGSLQAQANARVIFEQLVRPSLAYEFVRDRVTRGELARLLPPQSIDTVLDPFVDAALIRVSPGAERSDDRIEIIHEALIRNWEPLRRWAAEIRDRERTLLDLDAQAARWADSRQAWGHLLFGRALRDAEGILEAYRRRPRIDPTCDARLARFLAASRSMQRRLLTVAAVLATVLLAVVMTALMFRARDNMKGEIIVAQAQSTAQVSERNASLETLAYAADRDEDAARRFVQMLLSRGAITAGELPPVFAGMTPTAALYPARRSAARFDPAFLGLPAGSLPRPTDRRLAKLDLPNMRAWFDPANGLPILAMTQSDRSAASAPFGTPALYRWPNLPGQPDEAALARAGLVLARLVDPTEIAWGSAGRRTVAAANLLPLLVPLRQNGNSGRAFAPWSLVGTWLRLNHDIGAARIVYLSGAVPVAGAPPGTPPRQLWKIAVTVDAGGRIVTTAAMLPGVVRTGELPGRTTVAAIEAASGLDLSALTDARAVRPNTRAAAPAAAVQATKKPVTVYVQVPNLAAGQAEAIRGALTGAGFVAPAVEFDAPCLATPQVRYYYREDAAAAARAAGAAGAAARSAGLGDQTVAIRRLDRKAFPKARAGIIEFWICRRDDNRKKG